MESGRYLLSFFSSSFRDASRLASAVIRYARQQTKPIHVRHQTSAAAGHQSGMNGVNINNNGAQPGMKIGMHPIGRHGHRRMALSTLPTKLVDSGIRKH